jgi:hypothetical protein
MNDTELDQLLDTWHAPAAPRSLRDGLRERFPRAERFGFVRPLRWALAIALASITLAVVTVAIGDAAQSSDSFGDLPVVRFAYRLYENFLQGREARRAERIVAKIRQSEAKVFVDGRLMSPLQYAPAMTMNVLVPEEGLYSISLYRYMQLRTADGRPTGWVEAGHVHANMIEFQAGSKQVRIVCNQPIVDSDRPVFAMRRR